MNWQLQSQNKDIVKPNNAQEVLPQLSSGSMILLAITFELNIVLLNI